MSLDAALALRVQEYGYITVLISLAHFGAEKLADYIHSIIAINSHNIKFYSHRR